MNLFILLYTDSKIQEYSIALRMSLHTGESTGLKWKHKDTGGPSALKYCIETLASNAYEQLVNKVSKWNKS